MSPQALLDCQPELCQPARAVHNFNCNPGNLPLTDSRLVSIPTEFQDPLCNDPNLGPYFWHEDLSLDHTDNCTS